MGYYDRAQICENGHVITTIAEPVHKQDYCDRCGEKTIDSCPSCGQMIRGHYNAEGIVDLTGRYDRPAHCYSCGKPYPWTERALRAAKELAAEIDELTQEERDVLRKSLDDLVRDTPQATVAATRFKRVMRKAGAFASDGMRDILKDVLNQAIKGQIWG